MIANRPMTRRRLGSILPLVALLMVCLCGFTALSVEVATIATVKTQCQNAADAASLAGARTLNGGTTSSTSQAQANALAAASANSALGPNASGQMALVGFKSAEVSSTCGTYHYSTGSQTFSPAYTLQAGENYNLVKSSVQRQIKNTFFSVGGGTGTAAATPTITASAVAAHRPRDVAIVLDFSGSMNNESDLWNCESYLGSYYGYSNNVDPVVPNFGHYSSSSVAIVSTLTSPGGSSNLSTPVNGLPAEEDSYTQSSRVSGGSVSAFTSYPTSYASAPLGDMPATQGSVWGTSFGQPNWSTNVNTLNFSNFTTSYDPYYSWGWYSNFEALGYDYLYLVYNSNGSLPPSPSARGGAGGTYGFSGYTVGPKYWGKTFFMWPPDPRSTCDWRQLYFTDASNKPVVNNTTLWNASSHAWNAPYNSSTNYHVNYKAILDWIKNVGPNVFPPVLRAGRTCYYSYIPADVPASAYDHSQPNSNITDPSVRFWKEYIDYALGVWRDPYGNVQTPGSPTCSYGPDFDWGTVQITAKPTGTPPSGYKLCYMNYNDNPPRPRHRMWFGPMTMLQYIADTGISPATLRDISTYSAKLGIASVLQDAQINHPNDLVSLIFYSRPQYVGEPAIGKWGQALYNLNNNYASMINSLWYPPNSSSADVTPWDSNGLQTPNANADFNSNTTTNQGMMLAYNQFSTSPTLSALSNAGGTGRVGARKLVILETDGMANNNTSCGFTNNSGSNSYYDIQPGQSLSSNFYDQTNLLQVCQAICNTSGGTAGTANSAVANPGYPGFATASKPVTIQTIAFGIVFQINTNTQTNAVGLLQAISEIGGTTFPSSASDPTNGYKWCIGDLSTRASLLRQAFGNALNDGNTVSIIQ